MDAFVKPLSIRRVQKKRWKDEAGIFRDITNYKYQIFHWKEGKLLRHYVENGCVGTDEFMYLHLLKRSMSEKLEQSRAEDYLIVPDAFLPARELTAEEVEGLSGAQSEAIKEHRLPKLVRKLKKMIQLPKKQRRIMLRKNLYFILEKWSKEEA